MRVKTHFVDGEIADDNIEQPALEKYFWSLFNRNLVGFLFYQTNEIYVQGRTAYVDFLIQGVKDER